MEHVEKLEGSAEHEWMIKEGTCVQLLVDECGRNLYSRLHSAGHLLDISIRNVGLGHLEPGKANHFPDGSMFKLDELGVEIAQIAFPAALALTADPIVSLVDTAFIGRIGPIELAAVVVSIALFNQVSRIAIFPLVSVTTSFVAEEDALAEMSSESEAKELILQSNCTESLSVSTNSSSLNENSTPPRRHIPSASSALVIGAVLGLIQAIFLISLATPLLNFMGVKSDSPMLQPAKRYLTLRSLGAPAVLLSLAMQGVFRGFKDTKTPLYATGT